MKNVIILLLSLILLNSCDTNEPPVEENLPLIPLSVGNYWLYQGYFLKPEDGSIDFPQNNRFGFIIDDTISQFINGERIINYKLFNCGEELKPYYDKPGSFEGSKLIYHNQNGIYYSGIEKYDTIKIAFNDLIFPNPTNKGRSVNGHVFYYSTLGNSLNIPDEFNTQYTCVSIDSLFTTPLGDFSCIVYKMPFDDLPPLFRDEVYYFIKPGVGIVGIVEMIYHYGTDKYSYFFKNVLTEYKIN